MTPSPICRVTVTVPKPSTAFAGFATAISIDGIQCIVITQNTTDVQPLMDAIGFLPPIDMTQTKPVAVISRDDLCLTTTNPTPTS